MSLASIIKLSGAAPLDVGFCDPVDRILVIMGALIGIGAFINKNTFAGERLFGRGRLLEGGR